MRHWIAFLIFMALPVFAFSQEASHLKVELISEPASLIPGKPVTLGLHFTMDKGWHIYWQNPGDAGLAPTITWKLPIGFKAGKMLWPIPQRISLPSVMDFGYENEALLLVPVTVPKNLKSGELFNFTANVQWLVCQESCIPGQAALHLEIPVSSGGMPSSANPLFTAIRPSLPVPFPKTWKKSGTLDDKQFVLTFQSDSANNAVFFPAKPDEMDNNAVQSFQTTDNGFTLTLKRSDQLLKDVQTLEGLLVVEKSGGKIGYWVTIPLSH